MAIGGLKEENQEETIYCIQIQQCRYFSFLKINIISPNKENIFLRKNQTFENSLLNLKIQELSS